MLDHFHLPTATGNAEVFTFVGNGRSGTNPIAWHKPRGKTMIDIFLVGAGGNGGNGAIGANSAAAGGGGGGSGSQTRIQMPLSILPNVLYIAPGDQTSGNCAVLVVPVWTNAQDVFAIANAGSNGGNATGATAGTAGGGGGAATSATMPLGWAFATVLAGQAGNLGTMPTSGLLVTGGQTGSALGAAGSTGANGSRVADLGVFYNHIRVPLGGTTPTTPPENGFHGYQPFPPMPVFIGGGGGAATHGSATGTGLVQASGGNGAPGCGGGGSGGALTGSTPGVAGKGGPAFCVITCW